MSIARHHAEWLKLVEVSGPFLSLPVLQRAFPQGLEAHNPALAAQVRSVYAEWEAEVGKRRPDPAIHRAWVRWVLTGVLDYPADLLAEGPALPPGIEAHLAEEGETLRPDLALLDPDKRQAVLLIQLLRSEQDLEKRLAGGRSMASPTTRMMMLLHGTGVPLGLVTNGEAWMLVHAPRGETTGYATWYADLWREEPLTLRSFRSLLGLRRFFGVTGGERLGTLLRESASDQQEVTDRLGYQVRKAVEVLVQKLDRVDKERQGELLRHLTEPQLYQAALSVMMRLVFLFSAEERELLLLGDPLWDAHYAVSTLGPQLREEADRHGEEVLERRHDAWARLLTTFRAVHGGIDHSLLRLPAYGGGLFDPDRFPFLEGRGPRTSWKTVPAEPLPIDNRTTLHLLEALQYLEMPIPGGGSERRRLSFRALDIEQIGHVYEGLLDHTVKRATEPVVGLQGAKSVEPEVALSALETAAAQGQAKLLELLKDATKRSDSALKRALEGELALDLQKLTGACDNDPDLLERVRPYAGLLALDTHGDPVVIPTGSVFVTSGSDRRSTGTHYTPRSLTEPIVRHTLDPLVYRGMADDVPPSPETLIGPEEILKLKVVDFACGSGAFLVQACRYLSEKLVETWEREEAKAPGRPLVIPEAARPTGTPEERLLPQGTEERLAIARRLVADRCLYGVDKNPMAVEMAKLSLWLVTLQKSRPFEFLDHAIKCGDTLLGVVSVEQLKAFHLVPERGGELAKKNPLFTGFAHRLIGEALATAAQRRRQLESFAVNDIRDAEAKARLHHEAEEALETVRLIGDLITGAALSHARRDRGLGAELEHLAGQLTVALDTDKPGGGRQNVMNGLREKGRELLDAGKPTQQPPRRCFHWPIEFPEVFDHDNPGFHALVGNPPFQGGTLISGEHGKDYQEYLKYWIAWIRSGGRTDLCAYLILRGRSILNNCGTLGILATNTIAQGDTREVGLDAMVRQGDTIYRAVSERKWPGTASLFVSVIWITRQAWKAQRSLNGVPVVQVSAALGAGRRIQGSPFLLAVNGDLHFQGSKIDGKGFILSCDEAPGVIAQNPTNRDVLFPFLSGEDLNNSSDLSASRWVINFFGWPLERSASGSWDSATSKARRAYLRSGLVPSDYPDPVAADYPDCLAIVSERVKPYRTQRDPYTGNFKLRYPLHLRWWQYGDRRESHYAKIRSWDRVLATARVSPTQAVAWQGTEQVFHEKVVIFKVEQDGFFGVLQSGFHWSWASEYTSTLGSTTLNYAPSDCFESFPLPYGIERVDEISEKYWHFRTRIMAESDIGLTELMNAFNSSEQVGPAVQQLRELQVALARIPRMSRMSGDVLARFC